MSDAAASPTPASPWILSRWKDLALFVATPVLILPIVELLRRGTSAGEVAAFVAAFGAMGHHLPGMLRAYGDKELFQRFRTRFIVAPIFLLGICMSFAYYDLGATEMLVLLWGLWHGLAQTYGFVRIYDSKAGSFAKVTAKLDLWLCITWFGAGVLFSPERMGRVMEEFYDSGGMILSAEMVSGMRLGWAVLTAVVTGAFLTNLVIRWRAKQPVSLIKILLLITSLGFWWYTTNTISSAILGIALFEIFHDVQYLAIVWVFNRKRVDSKQRVGSFTRFVFRRSYVLIGLYIGLVMAYGYLNFAAKYIPGDVMQRTLLGAFTASAFLHFYFDGFIWKVREKSTAAGLGVKGGKDHRAVAPGWLLHGARWLIFVVPLVWLTSSQLRGLTPDVERYQALVDALPESGIANEKLGTALARSNPGGETQEARIARHQEAIEHLNKAVAITWERSEAHHNLAMSFLQLGQRDKAIEHLNAAIEVSTAAAESHTSLGFLLSQQGQHAQAAAHYEQAIEDDPNYAEAYFNMAALRLFQGRLSEAETWLVKTLEIDAKMVGNLNAMLQQLQRQGQVQQAQLVQRVRDRFSS